MIGAILLFILSLPKRLWRGLKVFGRFLKWLFIPNKKPKRKQVKR